MPPSFKPTGRLEKEKDATDAEKWLKDQERRRKAEEMAKEIADKHLKKREEESPWATDRVEVEGLDTEDLTRQIYGKLKKTDDVEEAIQDEVKEKKPETKDDKRRLEDLSESIGSKLRDKWNSRDSSKKSSSDPL